MPIYPQSLLSTGPVKILEIWEGRDFWLKINSFVNPADCQDQEWYGLRDRLSNIIELRIILLDAQKSGTDITFMISPDYCRNNWNRPHIDAIIH